MKVVRTLHLGGKWYTYIHTLSLTVITHNLELGLFSYTASTVQPLRIEMLACCHPLHCYEYSTLKITFSLQNWMFQYKSDGGLTVAVITAKGWRAVYHRTHILFPADPASFRAAGEGGERERREGQGETGERRRGREKKVGRRGGRGGEAEGGREGEAEGGRGGRVEREREKGRKGGKPHWAWICRK